MKGIIGVNQNTINGRTVALQGIKARETVKPEGDGGTLEVQVNYTLGILKKLKAGFIDAEVL
jgi:hypothetical protein